MDGENRFWFMLDEALTSTDTAAKGLLSNKEGKS